MFLPYYTKATFLSLLYSQVLSISNARIPIVKCIDSKSGLSCDISFKNKNAVHNSNFIKDIIGCHETIFRFALVIRYWALRQSLAGGVIGSGGLHINNYALTMLVIFFFQSETILPSVKKLQENMAVEESVTIDGWQFGYAKTQIRCLKNDLNKTLTDNFKWSEWLKKFYQFYMSFDYENLVISPYAGNPIPRKSFQELSLLVKDPKEPNLVVSNKNRNEANIDENLMRYWDQIKDGQNLVLLMNSPLCVQDPFEQNFCVSRSFSKVGILNWRNHCLHSLQYLQELSINSESGILGLLKMSVASPKAKKEQFEIIEKIQSAIGNKISLSIPKKRTKTRTGKPKTPNYSANTEPTTKSDETANENKKDQEKIIADSDSKTPSSDVKKRIRKRKNNPKAIDRSKDIQNNGTRT